MSKFRQAYEAGKQAALAGQPYDRRLTQPRREYAAGYIDGLRS